LTLSSSTTSDVGKPSPTATVRRVDLQGRGASLPLLSVLPGESAPSETKMTMQCSHGDAVTDLIMASNPKEIFVPPESLAIGKRRAPVMTLSEKRWDVNERPGDCSRVAILSNSILMVSMKAVSRGLKYMEPESSTMRWTCVLDIWVGLGVAGIYMDF
jgi:hypothetical protein